MWGTSCDSPSIHSYLGALEGSLEGLLSGALSGLLSGFSSFCWLEGSLEGLLSGSWAKDNAGKTMHKAATKDKIRFIETLQG